jgi:hypothetical protein
LTMGGNDMSFLESAAQRLLDSAGSIEESLERKPQHTGIRRAAYAAGGIALLTAVSAGISSLRAHLGSPGES